MKALKFCFIALLCFLPLLLASCAAKAKAGGSELSVGTEFDNTGYDDIALAGDVSTDGGLIEDSFTVEDSEAIAYDPNAVALPGADVSTGMSVATRPAQVGVGSSVRYTRYPTTSNVGYPERGGTTYQSPLTGKTYTVRKGDTLWGISRRSGVSVNTLAQANNVSSESTLRVGQTISVPSGSSSGGTKYSGGTTYESPITGNKYTVTPGSGGTYTVQNGDSYYKIAKKYGISYQALMEYNGATSSSLRVGQVLKIP